MPTPPYVLGPQLAVLTCAVSQIGISTTLISLLTSLPTQTLEPAIEELVKGGFLKPYKRTGWHCTFKGLELFYRTLGQVRDVLSPEQQAPTLPFTMTTNWRECLCLNYLVDPEILRSQLSPVFEPVLKDGKGIVSVTISSIVSMRPQGLPELLGQNFCNISHRAVVKFKNAAGEDRVGYEFTHSATNSEIFTRVGNTLTEYRFHDFATGQIHFIRDGSFLVVGIEVPKREMDVVAVLNCHKGSDSPPGSSLFASQAELDAMVLDHSDAFGYEEGAPFVYVLRIQRDRWNYRFYEPVGLYAQFFQDGPYDETTATLDNVVHCRDIRYAWQPLIKEAL